MRRPSWVFAGGLGLIATAAAGAAAQGLPGGGTPSSPPPHVMIGYVVNGPDQLLGGGAAWLPRFLGGWGVYTDFKTDIDSPGRDPAFVSGRSAEEAIEAGDERSVTTRSYTSGNAAIVRAFRDVVVYVGAGVTEESVYSEFLDPTGTLGQFGYYWAEYRERGGTSPNVLGGLFIRLGRHLVVQFGAEAVPTGVTVGLLLAL